MSIFGAIKDAIFGHKPAAPSPAAHAAPSPPSQPIAPAAASPAQAATTPISQVDVEANLTALAAGKDSNWKMSIVDLMKLLGIDSSLDNRKELARELGYSGTLDGSAEMNIWLHKATMRELAKNGGKVPASMTD
ncbi:MAG: DUF3597 domain-containing protein [Novosphingobium sp.]